jgi:crotonobetainyl-CoA:carnitine CoA-transferase CaiB-like acyl-CoA transferase
LSGLLEGLRVVETAVLLTGDYLGMLLADEGAEVIKVEAPGRGDYVRDLLGQIGPVPRYSPFHLLVNRNKASLSLDLRRDEAGDILQALVAEADVVVSGNVADTAQKLGIDYEAVRAIKPDIVYCQVTGFGAAGPYAAIPTHGAMMHALAGLPPLELDADGYARLTTPDEGAGMPSGVVVGPLFGAYAVVAAIYRRDRTGQGGYIDISCADSTAVASWPSLVRRLNAGRSDDSGPAGRRTQHDAKSDYYQTQDGKFIIFCCIEWKFWRNFCLAVERQDLLGRHDSSAAVDHGNEDADLHRQLQEVFRSRTRDEWVQLFRRHDIAAGPVLEIDELATDPHMASRQVIVDDVHPVAGPYQTVGSPIRIAGDSFAVRRHSPAVGQDTDRILADLGWSSEAISQLRRDGVI